MLIIAPNKSHRAFLQFSTKISVILDRQEYALITAIIVLKLTKYEERSHVTIEEIHAKFI